MKESVQRVQYSNAYQKPTKNEHERHETRNNQRVAPRVRRKVSVPCSIELVFFEVFLLLVRHSTVIILELNALVILKKTRNRT